MIKNFQIIQNHNRESQFFIMILFVFFSNTIVFAQKTIIENVSPEISIRQNTFTTDNTAVRMSNSVLNSNVNFILWFMGTKEEVYSAPSIDAMYSKKSIMVSGRVPNHLLLKTLLKKTINFKPC